MGKKRGQNQTEKDKKGLKQTDTDRSRLTRM